MMQRLVSVVAIVSTAIYLVPTGAHLFEMPAKLAMAEQDYMIVQRIYSGWSLFGLVLGVAVLANLAAAVHGRASSTVFVYSLIAAGLLVVAFVVFMVFTLPMNAASENWTRVPPDLETARRQWEYSHAVCAVLTFAALVSAVWASSVDWDQSGTD